MSEQPNPGESLPNRSSKDWSTKGIRGYVMLMYEFLRISPSYAIAHSVSTGEIDLRQAKQRLVSAYKEAIGDRPTAAQLDWVMEDFDRVLKTYADFRNVADGNFNQWWEERGLKVYGHDHERPRVTKIGRLGARGQDPDAVRSRLEKYLTDDYPGQGSPEALIVAIPLGIPKRTLLGIISKGITAAEVPVLPRAKKAKRPLSAQRLRSKPLFKYIGLLLGRGLYPKAALWRLGVLAKVSPTHATGLDVNKPATKETTSQRQVMAILASRALRYGKFIAENAAHGEFPSKATRPLIEFDWDDIGQRIRRSRPNLKARKRRPSGEG